MAKQCRLCGGLAEFVGKNVFGVDVYECSICKEPGHSFRFKETTSTSFAEREKLINSLLIHVYVGMCKDIKTETLKQILELIEQDQAVEFKGNL
jgi:hypothetical protein